MAIASGSSVHTGIGACASSGVSAGTVSTDGSVESVESVEPAELATADDGGAPATVPMAMARAMVTASAAVKGARSRKGRLATDTPLLTLLFYVTASSQPTFRLQLTGYPRIRVSRAPCARP